MQFSEILFIEGYADFLVKELAELKDVYFAS